MPAKGKDFSIALLNALIKEYQTKPYHYQSSVATSKTPNQGIEKSNFLSRNPFAGIKRHPFYRTTHRETWRKNHFLRPYFPVICQPTTFAFSMEKQKNK